VKLQNDNFFDARGEVNRETLVSPFCALEDAKIYDIDETDLKEVRDVGDISTTMASKTAQGLWPDLTWKPHTLIKRTEVFLEALKTLSEAHGVCIHAPFPTTQPIIDEWHGDESYVFTPLSNGGFTFDREIDPNA
jgi:hypothetical protein